jgi:hypothetical protein
MPRVKCSEDAPFLTFKRREKRKKKEKKKEKEKGKRRKKKWV